MLTLALHEDSRVSSQATDGARRAVGTHYGPIRIHPGLHCYENTWAAIRVALWTTLQIELRSDARRTNNRYCTIAPLDRQTYNAGYIHMEIEAPRPWCAGSDPDLRCRGSDEVC